MKKILLYIFLLLTVTGCTIIKNDNINAIINDIITSKPARINQSKSGYQYHLPTELTSIDTDSHCEILKNGKYKYYLYVDLVSYYNKTEFNYQINPTAYLSKNLKNENGNGYIEINYKNEKYLIEIMYNYAKIEMIVDEENIADAITNSLLILSSIKYNDDVIKHLMASSSLEDSEETFNIFETNEKESNFLEIVEEYGTYEEDNEVPDYDLIKE